MTDPTPETTPDSRGCHCPPCPGRGNDGHGMTHCAECCFGTGVEVEEGCPVHWPVSAPEPEASGLRASDEGTLFEYLDQYLNANGADPHVAGIDADGAPFVAWLDEEGGDCVGLRVARLTVDDGGVTSTLATEAPGQGQVSSIRYPAALLATSEAYRATAGEREHQHVCVWLAHADHSTAADHWCVCGQRMNCPAAPPADNASSEHRHAPGIWCDECPDADEKRKASR